MIFPVYFTEMHTLQPGNDPALILSIEQRYSNVFCLLSWLLIYDTMLKSVLVNRMCHDKIEKMKQTYINIQCVLQRVKIETLSI